MFEHTARQIAEDLGGDPSPVAQDIARRAREVADLFRSWGSEQPPDELRRESIQRVLDLHREAHKHKANRS